MSETEIDPLFISAEIGIELDEETHRILKQRIESADQGRLISAEEAREQFCKWLSACSTTKMP